LGDLCSPSSEEHLSSFDRPRILVVKWDRFSGTAIAHCASLAFPEAEISLFQRGYDALVHARSTRCWLGLVGLSLPDMDGLDLLAGIAADRVLPRLLVVSRRQDERSRDLLRRVPIDGYFDSGSEDWGAMTSVIKKVGNGGRYFSPTFGAKHPTDGGVVPLSALLTITEMQVFAVIGDGSDDRMAAERLGLSAKTVHTHRQHIMRKLSVQTRGALIVDAIRRGVVRIAEKGVLRPGFAAGICAINRNTDQG
jgi:DNA-binding NarL/FixJ family response regulator